MTETKAPSDGRISKAPFDRLDSTATSEPFDGLDGAPSKGQWMIKDGEIKRDDWDKKQEEAFGERVDKLFAMASAADQSVVAHRKTLSRESWLYRWLSAPPMNKGATPASLLTFLETNWTCMFFAPFETRSEAQHKGQVFRLLASSKERDGQVWMRFRISSSQGGALVMTKYKLGKGLLDDTYVHRLGQIDEDGALVVDDKRYFNLSPLCAGMIMGQPQLNIADYVVPS